MQGNYCDVEVNVVVSHGTSDYDLKYSVSIFRFQTSVVFVFAYVMILVG